MHSGLPVVNCTADHGWELVVGLLRLTGHANDPKQRQHERRVQRSSIAVETPPHTMEASGVF